MTQYYFGSLLRPRACRRVRQSRWSRVPASAIESLETRILLSATCVVAPCAPKCNPCGNSSPKCGNSDPSCHTSAPWCGNSSPSCDSSIGKCEGGDKLPSCSTHGESCQIEAIMEAIKGWCSSQCSSPSRCDPSPCGSTAV